MSTQIRLRGVACLRRRCTIAIRINISHGTPMRCETGGPDQMQLCSRLRPTAPRSTEYSRHRVPTSRSSTDSTDCCSSGYESQNYRIVIANLSAAPLPQTRMLIRKRKLLAKRPEQLRSKLLGTAFHPSNVQWRSRLMQPRGILFRDHLRVGMRLFYLKHVNSAAVVRG